MEEVQPPETPPIDPNGKRSEASLLDICEKVLSLEESTCEEALKLFTETKTILSANMSNIGSGMREEVERFWFAFILNSVKRLSVRKEADGQSVSGDNGFNLCQILRALKLNIVDFCRELPQFVVTAGPILRELYGADWENRLQAKELQANVLQLSLLSKYYKRGYRQFFLTYDANAEKTSANSASYLPDSYRFGWLLVLALRNDGLSRFKDLLTGLVSILAILIIHVPCRFRNFSTQDCSRFVMKGDKGVDLLASLCKISLCKRYDASEEELKKIIDKANNLIETILKKKPSSASECQTDKLDNINPDGLSYFEDLLDETSISTSLITLEKDYDDAVCNKGELDERVFINEEDSLLGSESLSARTFNAPKNEWSSSDDDLLLELVLKETPLISVSEILGRTLSECIARQQELAKEEQKQVILQVLCPNERLGLVIGKNRSTINNLMIDTSAILNITTSPKYSTITASATEVEVCPSESSPCIAAMRNLFQLCCLDKPPFVIMMPGDLAMIQLVNEFFVKKLDLLSQVNVEVSENNTLITMTSRNKGALRTAFMGVVCHIRHHFFLE